MNWETRLDRLDQLLGLFKSKVEVEPWVVQFTSQLNVNAPAGTETGVASSFVMVPPGYHGPMPEDVMTWREWLDERPSEE